MSTMFIRWRMHTVECKRQHRMVSRCVARMQHRSLASSFNRWTRETAKLQRDRVVVRRALERMRRKSLASAFYEWSDLMADRRRFAEKVVTADRFVGAMRHYAARSARSRWRDAARKLKRDAVKVTRCLQRMRRAAFARAFLDWAELVERLRRDALEEALEAKTFDLRRAAVTPLTSGQPRGRRATHGHRAGARRRLQRRLLLRRRARACAASPGRVGGPGRSAGRRGTHGGGEARRTSSRRWRAVAHGVCARSRAGQFDGIGTGRVRRAAARGQPRRVSTRLRADGRLASVAPAVKTPEEEEVEGLFPLPGG